MPMIRLDKLLANLGYNSRKGAAIMVKQGRMCVDGEIIKNPAHKIDPERQEVRIDDEPIDPPGLITIAMHKPEGVICDNDEGQHNIFQQIPFRWRLRKPGLSCAGRLDKDSRGLVILSEDGQLVHRQDHETNQLSLAYEPPREEHQPEPVRQKQLLMPEPLCHSNSASVLPLH